jgi:hypothetical protein
MWVRGMTGALVSGTHHSRHGYWNPKERKGRKEKKGEEKRKRMEGGKEKRGKRRKGE